MKRLIPILLLALTILIPSSSIGWGPVMMSGGVAAAGCPALSTGDLLHEDFDGNTEDLTWTDTGASGGVTDNDEATVPAIACDFVTQWLETTIPSGSNARSMTYTDLGDVATEIYVRFTFYLVSEGLEDTQSRTVFQIRSTAAATDITTALKVRQKSGQLVLAVDIAGTERDTMNIAVETSYCVELYYNNTGTGDSMQWKVDGVAQGTLAYDPANDMQRIIIGQYNNYDPNRPCSFMLDNLDISSTDWLGCP